MIHIPQSAEVNYTPFQRGVLNLTVLTAPAVRSCTPFACTTLYGRYFTSTALQLRYIPVAKFFIQCG